MAQKQKYMLLQLYNDGLACVAQAFGTPGVMGEDFCGEAVALPLVDHPLVGPELERAEPLPRASAASARG